MSLSNSQIGFNFQATQSKDNGGFNPTTQEASLSFGVAPDASVLNRVLLTEGTLAAGANTTVDLYSFTDRAGNATLATKARGAGDHRYGGHRDHQDRARGKRPGNVVLRWHDTLDQPELWHGWVRHWPL